jgi:cytoskeletal protein CcmA (bactofilin family)
MTDTAEPGDFLAALGHPQRPEAPSEAAGEVEAAAEAEAPAEAEPVPEPPVAAAPPAPAPVKRAPRPVKPGEPTLPPRRLRRQGADVHRMVVGREIRLSGTISACDQLLVEGTVEADLKDCDDLQIAEMGLFKGSATIGEADIRGRFEGTLVVRDLVIRASAKVTGKIRYAGLQIERGGQISGDVVAIDDDEEDE